MFGARMVCGIICKCYVSLIVAHDRYRSFLHVSHICQKLLKPNRFLHAMANDHILHLCCKQFNGWWYLCFHKISPTPTRKIHTTWWIPNHLHLLHNLHPKTIFLPPRHNLEFKMPFKYLTICSWPSNVVDQLSTRSGSPYSLQMQYQPSWPPLHT